MRKFNCIGKIFLISALIIVGVVGAQERWELVATTKEGSNFYIDTGSIIMVSPDRYLVWEKFYPVGRERQKYFERELKGIKDAQKFEYTKSRIEIDYRLMRHRWHYIVYYTWDSDVIKIERGESSEWYDYVPESVGWTFMERICTKGKVYDGKEM